MWCLRQSEDQKSSLISEESRFSPLISEDLGPLPHELVWKCPCQHQLEGTSSLVKEESVNFLNQCRKRLQGILPLFEPPTGPPTHRVPKTPQQQKGNSKRTKSSRSPRVNLFSPKVNLISPKVNVISPKVNVKYF